MCRVGSTPTWWTILSVACGDIIFYIEESARQSSYGVMLAPVADYRSVSVRLGV
jgi:hypothetical protein